MCWSPKPGEGPCPECGAGAPPAHGVDRRRTPAWVICLLGVAIGVAGTLAVVRSHQGASAPSEPVREPAKVASESTVDPDPEPDRPRARHVRPLLAEAGGQTSAALLLAADDRAPVVGLLPLGAFPLSGALCDADGTPLALSVVAIAEAYGFALLGGLDAEGFAPLRPRREPVPIGEPLHPAGGGEAVVVRGRSPHHPNELLLDREHDAGEALLDRDGAAAALTVGGNRALGVPPAWSWLAGRGIAREFSAVQAELRARDPAALLEDARRQINDADSPDAIAAALERLEVGFALAQARAGLRRFAGDIDWLADAVVLAGMAGEVLWASENFVELRSRDRDRANEHAAGLADAFLRAGDQRVQRAPREAVELLARGVELFPDHAALRMSYAGALLAAGDGSAALWQAQIAADRDPSLAPRLEAIAARTTSSRGAVEVPIDAETHVIRAACSVQGHPIELVVDTGASITVLPRSFTGAGTQTGRRVRIQTASGEVEADLVRYSTPGWRSAGSRSATSWPRRSTSRGPWPARACSA